MHMQNLPTTSERSKYKPILELLTSDGDLVEKFHSY